MLGSLEKLLERGPILGWSPEEPRRQSQDAGGAEGLASMGKGWEGRQF